MQVSVDVRASGFGAAAAFLLSVLVGLISGVSFGTVLLRALLSGIVFGLGVYGARILLARYVPDLLNVGHAESTGPGVDISVGDEEDDSELAAEANRGYEESGDGFDESLVEEVEEAPAAESQQETRPEPESGIVAEEDAEFLERADELPELEGFSGTFSSTASLDDDSEPSEQPRSNRNAEGLDSLDGSTSSGGGRDANDPKVMADAIRTVLKREK